jgi:hypothetical protein
MVPIHSNSVAKTWNPRFRPFLPGLGGHLRRCVGSYPISERLCDSNCVDEFLFSWHRIGMDRSRIPPKPAPKVLRPFVDIKWDSVSLNITNICSSGRLYSDFAYMDITMR